MVIIKSPWYKNICGRNKKKNKRNQHRNGRQNKDSFCSILFMNINRLPAVHWISLHTEKLKEAKLTKIMYDQSRKKSIGKKAFHVVI